MWEKQRATGEVGFLEKSSLMAEGVGGFICEVWWDHCESVSLHTHGLERAGSNNLKVTLNPVPYTRSRVCTNISIRPTSKRELLRILGEESNDHGSAESSWLLIHITHSSGASKSRPSDSSPVKLVFLAHSGFFNLCPHVP